MSTPQYRFSFSTFTRYAPCIGACLSRWPHPICVEVNNGEVSSHVQPIRDALTTKEQKGYQHPSIDEDLWQQYGRLITVSPSETAIWLGPREAVVKKPSSTASLSITVPDISSAPAISYVIKDHNRPLDYAFLLVQSRAIVPLPILIVDSPTEERIAQLTSTYPDVSLVPVEGATNKYQII